MNARQLAASRGMLVETPFAFQMHRRRTLDGAYKYGTAGRLDNRILIREQIYLAWLICRSNYAIKTVRHLEPYL